VHHIISFCADFHKQIKSSIAHTLTNLHLCIYTILILCRTLEVL